MSGPDREGRARKPEQAVVAIEPGITAALNDLEQRLLGTVTSGREISAARREELIAKARLALSPFQLVAPYSPGSTPARSAELVQPMGAEALQAPTLAAGPISHGAGIGASHATARDAQKRVCQDKTAIRELERFRVGAACDGVSAAENSELGAALVSEVAAAEGLRFLREHPSVDLGLPKNLLELHARIVGSVDAYLESRPGLKAAKGLDNALDTTLLMLLDNGTQIAACGLGSGALLWRGERISCSDLVGRSELDRISGSFQRRPATFGDGLRLLSKEVESTPRVSKIEGLYQIAKEQKLPTEGPGSDLAETMLASAGRLRELLDFLRDDLEPAAREKLLKKDVVQSAQNELIRYEALRLHALAVGPSAAVLSDGPVAIVSDGEQYLAPEEEEDSGTLKLSQVIGLTGPQMAAVIEDYNLVAMDRPPPRLEGGAELDPQLLQRFNRDFLERMCLQTTFISLKVKLSRLAEQLNKLKPEAKGIKNIESALPDWGFTHELTDALLQLVKGKEVPAKKIATLRAEVERLRDCCVLPRAFAIPSGGADAAVALRAVLAEPLLRAWVRYSLDRSDARERLGRNGIQIGTRDSSPIDDDLSHVTFRGAGS